MLEHNNRISLTVYALAVLSMAPVTETRAQIAGRCVAYCDSPRAVRQPPPVPVPNYGGGYNYNYGTPAAPQLTQQQLRARDLNDRAIKLPPEASIPMLQEAIRLWPDNKTFRSNLAGAQSLIALDKRNFELALAKAREAYAYAPGNFRRASLLNTESNILELKGDLAGALAKMREANAVSPSPARQKAIASIQRDIAARQGRGLTQKIANNAPFNIPGNPAEVKLQPPEGKPVDNKTASAQAGSALAHGEAARAAATNEAAKEQSGLTFDTKPTISGNTVDLRLSSQRGHPVLTPEQRQKNPQIAAVEKQRDALERELAPLEERFKELRKPEAQAKPGWGEQYEKLSGEIAEKKGQINYMNTQIKQYVLE